MPKSKRAKTYHLTQVPKRTREQKDRLFATLREAVPEYQHCFVLSVDNMRNNYLKDVRRDLSDSRLFFGKTKLMARALGQTPEEAQAEGLDALAPYLRGSVGLLFTNRDPRESVIPYFAALSPVDFARAGAVATRDFVVPPGVVYSTGGEVPAADDVPLAHTLEPELRRLGVPTRLVKGKVVLGDENANTGEGDDGTDEEGDRESRGGYVVCREGQVLDSRQTRLLKMFNVCLSEFRVRVVAYWSSATGAVTEVEGLPPVPAPAAAAGAKAEDAMEEDGAEEE